MIPKDWKEKNDSSIMTKNMYRKNIFTLLMDEDSMAGRPFWDWFKHMLKEFRKIKLKADEDLNIQLIFRDKRTKLTKRCFRGIPDFSSMGDINQLPPVAMKSIADERCSRSR